MLGPTGRHGCGGPGGQGREDSGEYGLMNCHESGSLRMDRLTSLHRAQGACLTRIQVGHAKSLYTTLSFRVGKCPCLEANHMFDDEPHGAELASGEAVARPPVCLSDKDAEFASTFLADREGYHHHKEQMAYAAFLVEAALFGAFVTTNWQSSWLFKTENWADWFPNVDPKLILWVILSIIWMLLHVFLRWQLFNRTIAALQVATCLKGILHGLQKKEVKPQNPPSGGGQVSRWLKYIIPCRTRLRVDVDLREYPEWYQHLFAETQNAGTGATFGEWLTSGGSILIMVLMTCGVWFLG